MNFNRNAVQRIEVLRRILSHKGNFSKPAITPSRLRAYCSSTEVTIDDVTKTISAPANKEYVPLKYLSLDKEEGGELSQSRLRHLRWMLQKDLIGQDMFLLGPPGPMRREIALQYLELTQREVEYVALSRDTTEADLKQRREIQNGNAIYFDQSAVRAATEGRILLLDGIEKAERNVLPVLNNLLENREMHLEDGRFLIPANRYDKLLELHGEEELKKWKLERVGEDFRVIALGLPVPRYVGSSLDPPLRSRFQARHVGPLSYEEQLSRLSFLTKAPPESLTKILSASYALTSQDVNSALLKLPDFPLDSLFHAAKMMENNPSLHLYKVLYTLYPYKLFIVPEMCKHIENVYSTFNINPSGTSQSKLINVNFIPEKCESVIKIETDGFVSEFSVPGRGVPKVSKDYVNNEYQNQILIDLLQSHATNDICIIGPKGCGKSVVVMAMANTLGYSVECLALYKDMSARDLLQRRITIEGGDTVWQVSPIVRAALAGKLLILDGFHRLHPSTGSVLNRLVNDRELQLFDGSRLLRHDRYDELIKSGLTTQQLSDKGIHRIHPSFRIVALAEPPAQHGGSSWLTPEILSLFNFHQMKSFSKEEELFIIKSLYGDVCEDMKPLVDLAHILRTSKDNVLNNLSSSISTRQLLRIAHRIATYSSIDTYETVQETFLAQFLPNLAKNALDNVCKSLQIAPSRNNTISNKKISCKVENGKLTIGNTTTDLYKTKDLTKVPDILFYDIPQHLELLEYLLQDFLLGNHLLLVGNQGVGKNKIADRLLQLLNRPREYIQLHRDTTVQSLTVQPTVKSGIVSYEDSALVKAVKFGHVLIVDEADKAPTHVTCILKTLVENGEMILSDGRRIVQKIDNSIEPHDTLIEVHPDFRMIVLANRPGFPFLGNDFFGALGDLFACHAVNNPSIDSETKLLRQYGPDVPLPTIVKLVKAFSTLRNMADQGIVTYPYSTREVVNIVKHLQKYPGDLASAIGNVFDFDKYSVELGEMLLRVLDENGFPTVGIMTMRDPLSKKHMQMTINRKSGLDVSGPKHGKVDPKGEAHVGGNTWAGGTGGRDTAGLGGKGGPYRLDGGHPVHQLSDAEKDDIPEHIKKAAREMNRKVFEERLREIKMSEYDAKLYNQFFDAVRPQVGALRGVLSNLQAQSIERQWTRNQTSGDVDDTKIIESLTGEENVYKRRISQTPPPGSQLEKPKLLRLLVDVSGSMYRFNSYDGRLDRSLEAVVLIMEAFRGFESRIKYDIWGHSGETHDLELVSHKRPPENEKERLQIIRTMHAHSQFCWSGDSTVPGVENAVKSLADLLSQGEDFDEGILVALSDANLSRYGIPPSYLANALLCRQEVQANVVFIGSLGDQANSLLKSLPVGRAFLCLDVSTLPQILQQIFTSSLTTFRGDSN